VERDELLFSANVEGVSAVRSYGKSCVVRAKDRVLVFDEKGAFKERAAGAVALEVAHTKRGEELLIATADRVVQFDAIGRRRGDMVVDHGVTALTRVRGHLVLGYENGVIEPGRSGNEEIDAEAELRESGEHPPRFSFEATPSSAVTRLVEGPMDTLVAGYANGWVGIWSTKNGALLSSTTLHGAVVHIAVDSGAVWAASELGGTLAGPDNFRLTHCELLARVWTQVPVIWSDGLPVSAAPRTDHPCAKSPGDK
jgi:hypothetical protein